MKKDKMQTIRMKMNMNQKKNIIMQLVKNILVIEEVKVMMEKTEVVMNEEILILQNSLNLLIFYHLLISFGL